MPDPDVRTMTIAELHRFEHEHGRLPGEDPKWVAGEYEERARRDADLATAAADGTTPFGELSAYEVAVAHGSAARSEAAWLQQVFSL